MSPKGPWFYLIGLLLLGMSWSRDAIHFPEPLESLRDVLRGELELNPAEGRSRARGYYEELNDLTPTDAVLAAKLRTGETQLTETLLAHDVLVAVPDARIFDTVASRRVLVPMLGGIEIVTNRFAMVGPEVELARAPGTTRIAVLGGSPVWGYGVDSSRTFVAELQMMLKGDSIELLNFGGVGYAAFMQPDVLTAKNVFAFGPRVLFWFGHPSDLSVQVSRLELILGRSKQVQRLTLANAWVRPHLEDSAFLPGSVSSVAGRRALASLNRELLRSAILEVGARARAQGVTVVWFQCPLPGLRTVSDQTELSFAAAREAGFHIVDLSGLFDGIDPRDLRIAIGDPHPNAQAHRLIAKEVARVLVERPELRALLSGG